MPVCDNVSCPMKGKTVDKPVPDSHFRLMALLFKVRDILRPRGDVLREAGIRPGFRVLDYGCGPGSYVKASAGLVGETGKVYALDLHPLAIRMVKDLISRQHLGNVQTILSDCRTGLPGGSVDVALLYDAFHDLRDQDGVLRELHRVLKPGGTLSFSDHHMKEGEILAGVTRGNLFRLREKGKRTYTFSKAVRT
jgi:ubiquinone/menaquinone biosynthesis C-methylase UbiE